MRFDDIEVSERKAVAIARDDNGTYIILVIVYQSLCGVEAMVYRSGICCNTV